MIRTVLITFLAAITLVATVLTPATQVRAATKYDGNWSVVIMTRNGPCDAAYRFSGQIVNGEIIYNGGGSIDFYGRVRPDGAAYVRVSSGSSYAVASGHLTVARGSGTWHGQTSGSRCSGTWSAIRV